MNLWFVMWWAFGVRPHHPGDKIYPAVASAAFQKSSTKHLKANYEEHHISKFPDIFCLLISKTSCLESLYFENNNYKTIQSIKKRVWATFIVDIYR